MTNHVCRVASSDGHHIIEGTRTIYCIAIFILCHKEHNTNEPEYDSICFVIHSPCCDQFSLESNEKQNDE
jgi:hypothetical protein